MSVKSFSPTDKWVDTFEKYGRDLTKLEGSFYVKWLPYALLNEIGTRMEGVWKKYQIAAYMLTSDAKEAKKFVYNISEIKSQLKLGDLLKLDRATGHSVVRECLTSCSSLMKERQEANQDTSRGFMSDLDGNTLNGLWLQFENCEWRLLADGLGFYNLDVRNLHSSRIMLGEWMTKNPNATVSRLYFEAEKLKMDGVCRFLNAIPLEGTPKMVPKLDWISEHLPLVTRFILTRLNDFLLENGFEIAWDAIALTRCKYLVEKNPEASKFDLLWQSKMHLSDLFSALKKFKDLAPLIEQFKEELQNGSFENKSPGGISLVEIVYLSEFASIRKLYEWNLFSTKWDRDWGIINMNVIHKIVFPKLVLETPLTFEWFILLYWQDPALGANLDLKTFCNEIIDILENSKDSYEQKACKYPRVIEAFRKTYFEIKPWRSYDPEKIKN